MQTCWIEQNFARVRPRSFSPGLGAVRHDRAYNSGGHAVPAGRSAYQPRKKMAWKPPKICGHPKLHNGASDRWRTFRKFNGVPAALPTTCSTSTGKQVACPRDDGPMVCSPRDPTPWARIPRCCLEVDPCVLGISLASKAMKMSPFTTQHGDFGQGEPPFHRWGFKLSAVCLALPETRTLGSDMQHEQTAMGVLTTNIVA